MRKETRITSIEEFNKSLGKGLWVNTGSEGRPHTAFMRKSENTIEVIELPLLRDSVRKACIDGSYERPAIKSRYENGDISVCETAEGISVAYDAGKMEICLIDVSAIENDIITSFEDSVFLTKVRMVSN